MEFLLYSLRMNAWVGRNGTGTSALADAKKFGEAEAFAYCRKAMGNDGGLVLFPVAVSALQSLKVMA